MAILHDRRLTGLGLVEIAPGIVGSSKAPAEVVVSLRGRRPRCCCTP